MGSIDISDEVDTLPNGQNRCKATAKGSGVRCKQPARMGTTVCRTHGGNAPQVQRKARLRLAELVDPAIGRLSSVLENGNDRDALRAVENVLDRAGYPRTANLDVADARALLRERLDKLRREAAEHPDRFAEVVDAQVISDSEEGAA